MKTAVQNETSSKVKSPIASKLGKRKIKLTAKRRSKSLTGNGKNAASTMADYGASAQRLMKSGRSSAAKAYNWVSETGAAIPDTVKSFGITDTKSAQDYLGERPLVLGAIGVGIGIAIGAMLPTMRTAPKAASKTARRK